mgnify:CR=1 FL=1|jgi:hypothetical protein
MDFRNELPLEKQFELQVFEHQIQSLSKEAALDLLVQMKEAMLYQHVSFQEILKEAWGLDQGADVIREALSEG